MSCLENSARGSLADLLAPSIEYAEKGFTVPPFIGSMWAEARYQC